MNNKTIIQTYKAPQAIGAYSQAVVCGNLVFISGQIPLDPQSGEVVSADADAQIKSVFQNLQAVCQAAGGTCDDMVKLNIYLTDLSNFAKVNETMAEFFSTPYPARAAIGVAALPKDVLVEVEGILEING